MEIEAWQSVGLIWLSGLMFAVVHSVSASQSIKIWSYQHGLNEPYYRLVYSLFSILTTVLWIGFVHSLPDTPLYHVQGGLYGLLRLIQGFGICVALAAFIPIDGAVFLGLKKAQGETDPFIVQGVYQYVRHPMYSGAMLMLVATPVQTWNGLAFALFVCGYFIVGARFEENRMLQEHADYADYQQNVGAFIPRLRG